MGQMSFFDHSNVMKKLSDSGDPLEKLDRAMEWKTFEGLIRKVRAKEKLRAAGRPAYDGLLMFKMLVLQSLYSVSDAQMEYQIQDRLSFRRFLGLKMEDTVPDAKTLWLFREMMTEKKVLEKAFHRFNEFLNQAGYKAEKGMIVDASLIEVPRQRNTREENKQVKNGETPEEWKEEPAKLRQKDVDARWVKKNGVNHYGYKNHVSTDVKHKLVRKCEVTSASVHDSQMLENLLDENNTKQTIWGDSAYTGEDIENLLKEQGIRNRIHAKGYRGTPLTKTQQKENQKKSRIRARVEHIFGFMATSMKAGWLRSIGLVRARSRLFLQNLVYNMKRFQYLESCA